MWVVIYVTASHGGGLYFENPLIVSSWSLARVMVQPQSTGGGMKPLCFSLAHSQILSMSDSCLLFLLLPTQIQRKKGRTKAPLIRGERKLL